MNEELHKLYEKQDILKNQISILISDRAFEDIQRSDYDSLDVSFKTPDGIDFDMLNQRPDQIKSKLNLEKIGIDIKIARKDMLPKFIITGNVGFNMYNLSSAHKFLANCGIVPSWDLFTGGRKLQNLKLQKDKYDIAVQKYEKTILISIQETNDALYGLKTADSIKSTVKSRLNKDIKELNRTKIRQEAGVADNADIILQEEKLINSKK